MGARGCWLRCRGQRPAPRRPGDHGDRRRRARRASVDRRWRHPRLLRRARRTHGRRVRTPRRVGEQRRRVGRENGQRAGRHAGRDLARPARAQPHFGVPGRQGRGQPHGVRWRDHQHLVRSRNPRLAAHRTVRRRQGRHAQPHPDPCPRARPEGDPRQRRLARPGRHRSVPRSARGRRPPRRIAGDDPARPPRHARRHRRGRGVPGLSRLGVGDRPEPAGGRWAHGTQLPVPTARR